MIKTLALACAITIFLALTACASANELTDANETYPHPFAGALAEFFVDIAPVPAWATPAPYHTISMPFSTHAILVDVDSSGTQGMLASKWTTDVQRYLPHSGAEYLLVQRLFLLDSNGQVRQVAFDNMAITPAGRLVITNGVDIRGASMTAYTLLDFTSGQLTPVISIMRTAYGHWEYSGIEGSVWVSYGEDDTYAVNHHTGDFWSRDTTQDQALTNAQFHALLIEHGLHNGANPFIWEWPDQSSSILLSDILD